MEPISDNEVISKGDEIIGTIAKKATDHLWYVRIDNPTYYDVLVPVDKLPGLKQGDKIKGIVEEINIAGDGQPGLFLKDINVIEV